jgi:hypothetical protein
MEHMLLYINLEDLANKTSLLNFMSAHASAVPLSSAMSEHLFMPASNAPHEYTQMSRMCLNNQDEYGTVKYFENSADANGFELNAQGVSPAQGLHVLFIQKKILDFLIHYCEKILGPAKKNDLSPPGSDDDLDHQPLSIKQSPTADHAVVVANAPFLPRNALDLSGVRHLVSSQMALVELDV